MRWVQTDWNEQRAHFALKIRFYPTPLVGTAFTMRNDANSLSSEFWQQIVVVQRILPRHHVMCGLRQRPERIGRVQALVIVSNSCSQVGRGPYFKKLIEVGRDNTQVPQPLKQRHVRPLGPVQHALIKSQDTVVTVQKLKRLCVNWSD